MSDTRDFETSDAAKGAGLVPPEPLIFEQSTPGACAVSLPGVTYAIDLEKGHTARSIGGCPPTAAGDWGT